jgi:transcription elongation factor GreA
VEITVGLNTPVRVRDLETTEEITFTIVDGDDIDPSENRISFASPVGMALLWRRVGDSVQVTLPHGQAHYEIIGLNVEREDP